jgi:UDP-N-acetylmuramoylalanine--D-glutamate ligase
MKDFDSVLIIGGGESGVGAALLAQSKGKEVFLSDFGSLKASYKKELQENNVPFEEGGHSLEKLKNFDLVVKSPGVSDKTRVMVELRNAGLPVVSEIELASYYTNVPIVGITGSNGKTTTTSLIYHLLKEGGVLAQVGGNIGKSFAHLIFEGEPSEVYVLELSSFQLDGVEEFHPFVAVLLNITPDHLDRYDYDFEKYTQAKWRIAMNLEEGDLLIVNENLRGESGEADRIEIRKNNYKTNLLLTNSGEQFDVSQTSLRGLHNRFNALCAIEVALHFGLSKEQINAGLGSFVNVPHRLQLVAVVNGVSYINDSKATNVDAVYYALEAMEGNVVWIVGGTDKGNDYEPIQSLVSEKVKQKIYLGLDNTKLIEYFGESKEARSMKEAIEFAFSISKKGDTVLLSPACASFDLFKNYEDRGQQFMEAVKELSLKNEA